MSTQPASATSPPAQAVAPTLTPPPPGALLRECEAACAQAEAAMREVQRLHSTYGSFLQTVHLNQSLSGVLVNELRRIIGEESFRQICMELSAALGHHGQGEALLRQNFYSILRLKDGEGKNPLEQIQEHYNNQLALHNAIVQIHQFQVIQQKCDDAQPPPNPTYAQSSAYIALLHREAAHRRSLTPMASAALSTAPTLQGNIAHLQATREQQAAFQLHATRHIASLEMHACHGPAMYGEFQNHFALEELKAFLADPSKDNTSVFRKYKQMPLDVQTLLAELVWCVSHQPEGDPLFGEHRLQENMRQLHHIQNVDGVNVIDQLLTHYARKIKLRKQSSAMQERSKEIDLFISGSNSPRRNTAAQRVGTNPAAYKEWIDLLLADFDRLSEGAKSGLAYQVWYQHGGRHNPQFGSWNYGNERIRENPGCLYDKVDGQSILVSYKVALQTQIEQTARAITDSDDKILRARLRGATAIPKAPIAVSTQPLVAQSSDLLRHLPRALRVAHITAELAGVASVGGLGGAVKGMARSMSQDPFNSMVIMPLYRGGPIKAEIINKMEATRYRVKDHAERIPIKTCIIDGICCYFIDYPKYFTITPKFDGSAGNLYECGNDHQKQRRWTLFSKAAADLCSLLSQESAMGPLLVHCHDGQTALTAKCMKEHNLQQWNAGQTPPVVLTLHNTAEPNAYPADKTYLLRHVNLPQHPINPVVEALEGRSADMITTVSPQFGLEVQTHNRDFGNGMDRSFKQAAATGIFYGICNGSSGCGPEDNRQLKTWQSALPSLGGDITVDLSYGVNSSDAEMASKLQRIRRELCGYLEGRGIGDPIYAKLDPKKPIIMYLGRYDEKQKGIGWLPQIMEETLAAGGQFVCIGSDPDHNAARILREMRETAAKRYNNTGVLILEDRKEGDQFLHQKHFITLMRACAVAALPSSYEPYGLVQIEQHTLGGKVMASGTGGFVPTVITEGPNANGYLFERLDNWHSAEQSRRISATLARAIEDEKAQLAALFSGPEEECNRYMQQRRNIMQRALQSTWETTPPGAPLPSPRIQLDLVYAEAFRRRQAERGIQRCNLPIAAEVPSV